MPVLRPDGHVVVFGGSGFLGKVIVRRLLEAGCSVRVVARQPWKPAPFDGGHPVETVQADVCDEAAVRTALKGVDAVVNTVSLYVETREYGFRDIHVTAAGRLARLAAEEGIQSLVHISGIGVDTESPSAYVRARAEGEQVVTTAFPQATVLRPSVLFGPDDVFLGMLAAITRLPVIPLFGRGATRLQPVHVGDVALAVVQVMREPAAAAGRCFELGGAETLSYRDIIKAVLHHTGHRRALLPVPFPVWHGLAFLAGILPQPPLTRDQIILMQQDNITGPDRPGFTDLGITPRALTSELGICLG